MALNIKNREADKLATELARRMKTTKTEAVLSALREKLERVRRRRLQRHLTADLTAIAERCARLPVLDRRSADEILGYNDHELR